MKKGILAAVGVIIVAVVLMLVFGHKKTTPKDTMNMNTSKTTTAQPAASDSNAVSIENFAFSAKTITVKKGTKVTWTNKDSASHTVTFNDSALSAASSSTLAQNATFSHTFDTVGSFSYHCAFHSAMTGTVVVTE